MWLTAGPSQENLGFTNMNKRCLEDNPSPAAKPHVFLIIHQKQMSYQEFISELSDSVAMLGYT